MNKRNGQEKQRRVKAKKTVAFIPSIKIFHHFARQLGLRQLISVPVSHSSLNLNSTASKRFNLLSLDGVVRMCVSKRLMTKKVDPGGSPPDAPSLSPAPRENYDRMLAACYPVIASGSCLEEETSLSALR